MPVCHKRKLAFCHVPRTGGVSIVRALGLEVNDKHNPASYYRENYPGYTLFSVSRSYEDRKQSAKGWKGRTKSDNVGLMMKPNDHFLDTKVDFLLNFDNLQDELNSMLKKLGHRQVKLQQCNSFKTMNIVQAIQNAERLKSNISGEIMAELQGLSSPKVRHLLNNLASQSENYLEIGTYLGGTLRAALTGNEHLYSVAIDKFSMFPKKRQEFFNNTNMVKYQFIEEDSFSVDLNKIEQKIGLYFYDGDHSFEAHKKAITYYYPILKDEFVYVCDDWSAKRIPNATFEAAKDMGLEVLENYDLLNKTPDEWWRGIGVIRFRKTK